jgi:IclR helix-turn-helix domain
MQWALEFYGTEWLLLGEATDIACSEQRQKIRRVLASADEPLSPSEIAAATEMPAANVKKLLSRMLAAGEIARVNRGLYTRRPRADPATPVPNVPDVPLHERMTPKQTS